MANPPAPKSVSSTPISASPTSGAAKIAGLSVLKGLVLYGAELTFAGLYIYFIIKISGAKGNTKPGLDATLVSTAAALSGVLGSAFALYVGTPTSDAATNSALKQRIKANAPGLGNQALTTLHKTLSLEPGTTDTASWPLTFGLWLYAIVAAAVALTYILNQNETPGTVKALAVAFGGYVIALITAAYGIQSKNPS